MADIEDCDISSLLQREQISEALSPFLRHLPTPYHNCSFNSLEFQDGELMIELEDDPYHSYKVEGKLPWIDIEKLDEPKSYYSGQILKPPQDMTLLDKIENTGWESNELAESEAKNETSAEDLRKIPEKGYDKNIIGYVAKKVINMMFAKYSKQLCKKCGQLKLNYKHFRKIYKSAEEKLTGPVELNKLFHFEPKDDAEKRMKILFYRTFNKILRKNYLIYSLKLGKMRQMEPYIRKKNTHLLYFVGHEQML